MAEYGGSIPAKHIAAVVAGNALEFYDFLTYAYFAVYIGRAFFPSRDPTASLLASLGTFGVGFIMRPIGGWIIGGMGDRIGRKPAMILSFCLMGVAIAGLALTPPYVSIGVAAPVLAIGFRLLQGFALGGEIGPTTAFLLESVPVERRGFFGAFQSWTQNVSTLASGLVGFGLASVLNPRQLQDYGWRVAFLIGAAIVPFGLLLRRSLPETLYQHRSVTRERVSLRPYLSVVILGLLIMAGGTIGVYIIRTYMTTYAITTLHMAASSAFAATVVAGTCGVIFVLLAGSLSDRIGRKPVMLLPSALMLVLILPGFSLLAHYRTVSALLVVTAVLSSLAAISICPYTTWLAESLPPALRSGAVAVIYAIAVSVFGGTTQYAVTWLIRATGNPLAPAWYWIFAAAVGTAAMYLMRESAPFKAVETDRVRRVLVEE